MTTIKMTSPWGFRLSHLLMRFGQFNQQLKMKREILTHYVVNITFIFKNYHCKISLGTRLKFLCCQKNWFSNWDTPLFLSKALFKGTWRMVVSFSNLFFFAFFLTEETLYNIECGRTMAHYCTHLVCRQWTILYSIMAGSRQGSLAKPLYVSMGD